MSTSRSVMAGFWSRSKLRLFWSIAASRELHLSVFEGWGYPLPPRGGYFARKIFVLNNLRGVGACKILITNGLHLKYLLSIV
jgi:hypothetical protein